MDNLEQALLESENSLMLLSDEELITPINDMLIINPETRLIEVPNTELLLGVFGENLVEKKYFKCPRIVLNNIDLYECFIFINYVSVSGRVGYIQSENVELDETGQYILFDWDLTSNVFDKNKDSTIYFSVSAKQYLEDSEPVFATRKAQGKMYETINGTEYITQEHADIILQILAGMKTKVDLPKDEDGNLLVPEEGQTLLFKEDGTTYYGTPSSGGGTSFSGSAKDVTYDDTETKLGAENVQDAIGKLSEDITIEVEYDFLLLHESDGVNSSYFDVGVDVEVGDVLKCVTPRVNGKNLDDRIDIYTSVDGVDKYQSLEFPIIKDVFGETPITEVELIVEITEEVTSIRVHENTTVYKQEEITIGKKVSSIETELIKVQKEIGDLSQLSAYGTNVAEILLKLINGGTLTPDEEEELSGAIPVVRITGDLTGISADDYVNVTCDYTDESNNLTFTDYAEFAYQGSGSLAFTNVVDGVDVAKNFKIKLYSDEARTEKNKRVFKDWHATNNFHLKCNYADATNIMNNLMMNYLTKSYQYLTPLPREGARYTVDGFPVLLYVNDVFTGIRFWNLKQDDKVYNLNEEIKDESTGEVTQEADLCYQIGRNNGTNTGDNSGAFIYGNLSSYGNTFADAHEEIDWYWEDRVWDKVSNHPSVLYDTIQWVSEASDDEFKANLTQYFDKEYLIHYFVMMYVCGMIDSKGKNFNMLYFPEKGVWYPTFWDMDNAFGTSYGVSKSFVTTSLNGYGCPSSRLFDKLYANFEDEIIEHYQKLRPKLFTLTELEDSIDKTLLNVSSSWLAKNFEVKYDGTSYSPITDPKTYILDWASKRFEYMDTVLVKESSDDIPTTSISLDKNTLTFVDTNAQSLVATVLPTDSTQTVSWESSNDSIATVLNGVVTPIGNGECTITATSGDYSAICHVKVNVESLNVMYEKGYINNTGSLTQANYNIVGTEYIEVESDKFYRINLSDEYDFSSDVITLRIAEYDSEKNFIKRYYSETATIALDKSMIKVSADCKYVRLGFNLKNYYDADAHEKYTSLFERTQFVEIENAMSDLNITFSQGNSHGTGTEANRVTMNIGECKFVRTMNISVGEGYSLFIYAVNGEQISSPTIGAWHDSNITLSNNSGLPTTDGYIKPYSSLVSSEIVIKSNDNKDIAPNEIENLVVITWT